MLTAYMLYMLVYWYVVYLHQAPSTLTGIVLCTGRRRRYLGVHIGTLVFVVPRFMGMEIWPSALKSGILHTTVLDGCRCDLHVSFARYVWACELLDCVFDNEAV